MPQVQIQRIDSRGSLVELVDVDLRDNHEYLEVIAPLERVAREDGGTIRTVSPGAPLFIGTYRMEGDDDEG